MKESIWGFAIFFLILFLWYWFIPFIKTKWILWWYSVELRRMSKKYDKETADKLMELSKGLKELSKNEKL